MGILCRTFLDGGARVFCDDVDGETILRIIQDYKVNLKRIQINKYYFNLSNSWQLCSWLLLIRSNLQKLIRAK
jgi:hypothetical protein